MQHINGWHNRVKNDQVSLQEFLLWNQPIAPESYKIGNKTELLIKCINKLMHYESSVIEIAFTILSIKEEIKSFESGKAKLIKEGLETQTFTWEIGSNFPVKNNLKCEHAIELLALWQKNSCSKEAIHKYKELCENEEKVELRYALDCFLKQKKIEKLQKKVSDLSKKFSQAALEELPKKLSKELTCCVKKNENLNLLIFKIIPLACVIPILFTDKELGPVGKLIKDKILKKSSYFIDQNKKYISFMEKIVNSENEEKYFDYLAPLPYPIKRKGIGIKFKPYRWLGVDVKTLESGCIVEPAYYITYSSKDAITLDLPEEGFMGTTLLIQSMHDLLDRKKTSFDWLLGDKECRMVRKELIKRMDPSSDWPSEDSIDFKKGLKEIELLRNLDSQMIESAQSFWSQLLTIEVAQEKFKLLLDKHKIKYDNRSLIGDLLPKANEFNSIEVKQFIERFSIDNRKWLVCEGLYLASQAFISEQTGFDLKTKEVAELYLAALDLQCGIESLYSSSRKLIEKLARTSQELLDLDWLNTKDYVFVFMRASCFIPVLFRHTDNLFEMPLCNMEDSFERESILVQQIAQEAIEILTEDDFYLMDTCEFCAPFYELYELEQEWQRSNQKEIPRSQEVIEFIQPVEKLIDPKTIALLKKQRLPREKKQEINQKKGLIALEEDHQKSKETRKHSKTSRSFKKKKFFPKHNDKNDNEAIFRSENSYISGPKKSYIIEKKTSFISQVENMEPILLGEYPKLWQEVKRDPNEIKEQFEIKYATMQFDNIEQEHRFFLNERARHAFPQWIFKLANLPTYSLIKATSGAKNINLFGWMKFETGEEHYGVFEWISLVSKSGEKPLYRKPHHCYFNNLSATRFYRSFQIRQLLNNCKEENLANKFEMNEVQEVTQNKHCQISIDKNEFIKIEDFDNKTSIRIFPLKQLKRDL